MSSFGVYNRDVTFPDDNVIGSIFPAPAGCLGMGFLGGTLAESLANIYNPDAPLTAVGAPFIDDYSAAMDPANCFDTGQIAVTGDFTYAVVASLPATANAAIMMGNLRSGSGANNGDGLAEVTGSGVVRGYFGFGTNTSVVTSSLNQARHRLMVQRLAGTTGRLRVYDDTATPVALSASPVTVSSRNASTRSVRVGSGQDVTATFGSPTNIAWWGLWNRAITDAEIETDLRAFLAATLDPSLDAAV